MYMQVYLGSELCSIFGTLLVSSLCGPRIIRFSDGENLRIVNTPLFLKCFLMFEFYLIVICAEIL